MKFALAAFIIFAIFLTPLYPVYALDTRTSTTSAGTNTGTTSKRTPQLKERINTATQRKETLKDLRAEHASKVAELKAQFRTRLNRFKDKRKVEILERINDRLNRINEHITDMLSQHVDKLNEILSRVKKRLAKAPAGANLTEAQAAIADAEGKIASASAAISLQAAKDYTIKISSESGAKNDAKLTKELLHTDLRATRETVKEARQALIDAISLTNKAVRGGVSNGQ